MYWISDSVWVEEMASCMCLSLMVKYSKIGAREWKAFVIIVTCDYKLFISWGLYIITNDHIP